MNPLTKRLIALVLALSPLVALAQTPLPENLPRDVQGPIPQERLAKPDTLVSCFDFYRFGSVPAVVQPSLSQVSQGTTVSFTGTVTNENAYPVPNVDVWAKVFKPRSQTKDPNGPDVMAWIKVAEDLDLPAGGQAPLSFTWDVPADAEPGDYQLATFVTSSDRFELAGLSFTDDVIGNITNFEVLGQQTGGVRFDKGSVSVNGRPFRFAAFPPTIPPQAPSVPVEASIDNTTDVPFTGTVTWELRYWDRLSNRTLIKESSEEVKIHPHSSTTLSYVAEDQDHTVYYLVGTLTSDFGSESVIGVRFVRSDVNMPRFNFVTGTPASKEGPAMAIACIHSMGHAPAENGRVVVSARRPGPVAALLSTLGIGRLAAATYEGPISEDIYALAAPLSKNADNYVVDAKLYQDGRLVDSVSIPYCAQGNCKGVGLVDIVVTVLALIVIVLVLMALYRRRPRSVPPAPVFPPM